MNSEKSFWAMPALALLPLWHTLIDFKTALFLGGLVTLSFWGSRLLFFLTRSFLPEKFQKGAAIFCLIALGQVAWYLWRIEPFWIISCVFLLIAKGDSSIHSAF